MYLYMLMGLYIHTYKSTQTHTLIHIYIYIYKENKTYPNWSLSFRTNPNIIALYDERLGRTGTKDSRLFCLYQQDCNASLTHKTELMSKLECQKEDMASTIEQLEKK